MEWKPHITVATVVEDHGRFLMVEELKHERAVLNQPAGHLDAGESLLDAAVRENVMRMVNRLRNAEGLLLEPQRSKQLMVVGARYDLDDGSVEFFEG